MTVPRVNTYSENYKGYCLSYYKDPSYWCVDAEYLGPEKRADIHVAFNPKFGLGIARNYIRKSIDEESQ